MTDPGFLDPQHITNDLVTTESIRGGRLFMWPFARRPREVEFPLTRFFGTHRPPDSGLDGVVSGAADGSRGYWILDSNYDRTWRRLDGGSELKSQRLKRPLLTRAEMQLICVVGSGHGDPAVRQHARTLEGNPRERGPRDGHVTVTPARLEAHMTLVIGARTGLSPVQREPCSPAPRVNSKCPLVALNVDHVPGYFHVRSVAGMRRPCLNRAAPTAQSR